MTKVVVRRQRPVSHGRRLKAKLGAQRRPALREAAALRRDILQHIDRLCLPTAGRQDHVTPLFAKEAIRLSHLAQRRDHFAREFAAFGKCWPELVKHFAHGTEVVPEQIAPVLEEVISTQESGALFRFACLLWSVPVSRGYGRRMRFLVRDRNNGKLIGLFGLSDPVFNLRARDNWIGWTVDDRSERLVNVMDAYVVGAVPPYSDLLGGKLVVSLIGSAEVCREFHRKYAQTRGVISRKRKAARLVLLTVTSALGRSSLYNRVKLDSRARPDGRIKRLVELIHVGSTMGYGHFQLSDELFNRVRALLAAEGHQYANGHKYGQGPNWRMRLMRVGFERLGLDPGLTRHGIQRESFAMPLAPAFRDFLSGRVDKIAVRRPSTASLAQAAIERWVLPRAHSNPAYKDFRREMVLERMTPSFSE